MHPPRSSPGMSAFAITPGEEAEEDPSDDSHSDPVVLDDRRVLTALCGCVARPPKPPQLDQKTNERTSPTIPTISRITPTTWMSTPEASALTAHVEDRAGSDEQEAETDSHVVPFA